MCNYYTPNWAQVSSKSVCFWEVNCAIFSSSINTENGEIKWANVKFYIADAIGDYAVAELYKPPV